MKHMRKLIALSAFALAACAGNTDKTTTDKAPAAEPAPATPPAIPEPPPASPAATAPTEAPKAAEPAPTDSKATAKPAGDKAAAPTSNLKPGLYAHFQTNQGNFTAELNEKAA